MQRNNFNSMFRVSGNATVNIGRQVLCADGYVSVLKDRILKTYRGNACDFDGDKVLVDGKEVSNYDERYVAVLAVGKDYFIPSDYHRNLNLRRPVDLCRDDEFMQSAIKACDWRRANGW